MTSTSSSAALAASNPHSCFISSEVPPVIDGVVRHAHITAWAQIRILAVVDETGSASIRDVVEELSDLEDPLGAVLALVSTGILELVIRGVLDEHSLVRRVIRDADPEGSGTPLPPAPDLPDLIAAVAADLSDIPEGLESLGGSPFHVHVTIGSGANRRLFAQTPHLRRSGIYLLLSSTAVYVGTSGNVGARVATGGQPIDNVETICVITDAFDNLTPEQALIAERNLYARACAAGELKVVNEVPIGAPCDVELFGQIDAFVGAGALMLHHRGIFFHEGSPRSVLAGPRSEPARIGPRRLSDAPPEGELLELQYGAGLVAHAVRQTDDRWLLLEGSHVRLDAAPSGNRGMHFSRAQWLHTGLLALAPDGKSFVTTRDLYFPNGSSACQLCAGGKGRPLSAWQPIDPDGDLEALTLAA